MTKFRVDCTDDNRTWASNALTFETEEEAEQYAVDLGCRWHALRGWRVVPVDHPQREAVDYDADHDAGRRYYGYSD